WSTKRTFRGEVRTFLPLALTSITSSLPPLRRPHLGCAVRAAAGMTAKSPRHRELAEPVADHVLCNEDRHVTPAIVNGDRQAHHLGHDCRRARPGAQHSAG